MEILTDEFWLGVIAGATFMTIITTIFLHIHKS